MRNYLPLLLSLALAGCPDDTGTTDTGTDPVDAPTTMDVPATVDAPVATDDVPATTDAALADAPTEDDAPATTDAPALLDTRVIPPGECNESEPCPPTCIIANSCVSECGGPVTNCGCCPCAEGSVNVLSCSDG